MATLLLDNVPDKLLNELEQMAAREQLPVAEKTVRLLQQVMSQRGPSDGRSVKQILDRLIQNRFRPDPAGPDVVEMLREDRDR